MTDAATATNSKILVVDDSRSILKLMIAQISRSGYSVFAAETGEQALEIAFAELPDLILLDINLPGISGFEVLKQLKHVSETSKIPVIMVSSAIDLESQLKGFASGVVDFVIKPTMEPVLLARIRLHLELSRVRNQLDQSNRQLRASEARYRLIAENTGDVIWSMNPHSGRFTYISPSVVKMRGYTAEEAMEQSLEDALTPDSYKKAQSTIAETLAEIAFGNHSNLTNLIELEQPCKDGSTVWIEVISSFLLDEQGLLSEIVGVSRDCTQRRQHEAELLQMHAQLLQNEKLASIGQLAAGIAHEINNPMGFINSNLSSLKKYLEKYDSHLAQMEELLHQTGQSELHEKVAQSRKTLKLDYIQHDVHHLLSESAEGAERVMRIVQDLKTFARSDSPQTTQADINPCLDSTINIIWNQIKYVADLVKEYGDLPRVTCNIQQINQVFLNLLVNAAHAIEALGENTRGIITVRTWSDGENVLISFTDNGCGIPEENRSRIFDPFFTTKEVGKGTGLGLSISCDIIRKHGGMLTVESEVGKGTTFIISLPVVGTEQIRG